MNLEVVNAEWILNDHKMFLAMKCLNSIFLVAQDTDCSKTVLIKKPLCDSIPACSYCFMCNNNV